MEEQKRKSAHWLIQVTVAGIVASLATIVLAPLAAPLFSGEVHVWGWLVHLNWLVIGSICLAMFVLAAVFFWVRNRRNRWTHQPPYSGQGAWGAQGWGASTQPLQKNPWDASSQPQQQDAWGQAPSQPQQQDAWGAPSQGWGAASQQPDPWQQPPQGYS